MTESCPCGSGLAFADCCEPLLENRAEAAHAEQLMRSRFSAFAKGKVGYLWHTLHPDHDEKGEAPAEYVEHLRRGLRGLVYKRLDVRETKKPDADGIAQVKFHATVFAKGRDISFTELSSFANDGTGWRYLFGVPHRDD